MLVGNRYIDVSQHESDDGAVVTITLDNPEKRNALALDVMIEVTDALREVADGDAVGVVLAANGPVFSAGHNFGDMLDVSLPDAQHVFQVCTEMMTTIQEIPLVADCEGARTGHCRRLPVGRLLRPRRRRRVGGLRAARRQRRAVLSHATRGGSAPDRSQAGARDGDRRVMWCQPRSPSSGV